MKATTIQVDRQRRSARTEPDLGGYITEWDPRLCQSGDDVAGVHDSFIDVNADRKDPTR